MNIKFITYFIVILLAFSFLFLKNQNRMFGRDIIYIYDGKLKINFDSVEKIDYSE